MEVFTVVKKISSVKMFKFWSLWCMNSLLLLLLLWALTLASGHGSNNTTSFWQTLHGNKTSRLSKKFMLLVDNKGLASLTAPQDLPPAQAPKSIPTETNLVEPPLPSVVSKAGWPFDARNGFTSSAPSPKPGQPKYPANSSLSILIILFIVMVVLVAIFIIGVIFVTILAFVSQWACPGLREWLRQFDI